MSGSASAADGPADETIRSPRRADTADETIRSPRRADIADEAIASPRRGARVSDGADAAPGEPDDATVVPPSAADTEVDRTTEAYRVRSTASDAARDVPDAVRRSATSGAPEGVAYKPRSPGPAVARERHAERPPVDVAALERPRRRSARRWVPLASFVAGGVVLVLLGAGAIALLVGIH